jgi:hypothetical protein
MSVIPPLEWQRQEDVKFEVSLSYRARPVSKKNHKNKK